MQRIHIVGCSPRSGTTLIMELFKHCFNIDLAAEHECRIFDLPPRKCKIYLSKKPRDIVKIEQILKTMKNLTVIYMVRDPRDVIVSKHGKHPDKYWTGLGLWKYYVPNGKKLEKHPRFITIRYEDLVTNPNKIQHYILDKIPYLKQTKTFEEFKGDIIVSAKAKRALNGIREVSASRIGNWKNHLPRIKSQIKMHGDISEDLIYYGYEENKNWLHSLKNIKDVDFASVKPEFPKIINFEKKWILYKILAYFLWIGHLDVVLALKSLFNYRDSNTSQI